MELRDIRTLTLLRELEREKTLSQRELAEKLDMSLGLVNLYLKRLAEKSYFKIKTYPRNRVGYLLTPKGMLEKTRLTYEYIHHSLEFYTQARAKLKKTLQQLEARGVRTMAFLGATEISEIAYLSLKETGIELVAVIDDKKAGQCFMGFPIISAKEIEDVPFDCLLDNTVPIETGKNGRRNTLPVPPEKIVSGWQT